MARVVLYASYTCRMFERRILCGVGGGCNGKKKYDVELPWNTIGARVTWGLSGGQTYGPCVQDRMEFPSQRALDQSAPSFAAPHHCGSQSPVGQGKVASIVTTRPMNSSQMTISSADPFVKSSHVELSRSTRRGALRAEGCGTCVATRTPGPGGS
ncbi:hypothetical protein BC827DRAFT_423231 [Russula dissimulans]|nr:hypothetical protein BC827DRAFT_423231 [Russula dissimulans]